MSQPLISIITINFNNKRGLAATIHSVMEQVGFSDYEHLIIDGGSTDGSTDIIHQYQHKFTYYISEKDAGIYDAMNKGIQKATGRYILFLNSGDFLAATNVLADVNDTLQKDSYDIVYGNTIIDNGKTIKKNPSPLTVSTIFLSGIAHQGMFFKRILFTKAGLYDTTYKVVADMCHLIICLIRYNANSFYINMPVAQLEPGGVSTVDIKKNRQEKLRFMNTEFPAIASDYETLLNYHKKDYLLRAKHFISRKIR